MQRPILMLLVGCGALLAAPIEGRAAPGTGCDGFLWPLATEIAWIKADDSEKIASGAKLAAPPMDRAMALALEPASKVAFPASPTSTPKPEDAEAFGGVVYFDKLEAPGQFQVTMQAPGWIDVVQDGKPLEAIGHTGATGCEWARKSIRFEIGPGPFSIQVNAIRKDTIKLTIRPAAD